MHPIDRLGEIRQQMRKLRQEQREIILKLDAGTITAEGVRYKASTHQRVVMHPILQPAPPELYSYHNPLSYQQPWPNQAQNQFQPSLNDPAFGQGRFGQSHYRVGEPAFGVGKREG